MAKIRAGIRHAARGIFIFSLTRDYVKVTPAWCIGSDCNRLLTAHKSHSERNHSSPRLTLPQIVSPKKKREKNGKRKRKKLILLPLHFTGLQNIAGLNPVKQCLQFNFWIINYYFFLFFFFSFRFLFTSPPKHMCKAFCIDVWKMLKTHSTGQQEDIWDTLKSLVLC